MTDSQDFSEFPVDRCERAQVMCDCGKWILAGQERVSVNGVVSHVQCAEPEPAVFVAQDDAA